MPAGFKLQGIAPYELRDYPDSIKLMYWGWIAELGVIAKDKELSRGLDAQGEPLRPIAPATRKHRKSAMTPDGRGDPSAPPLMPGRALSRTRSLLAGKAFTDHAAFYWRFDPFTMDSWAKILTIHKRKGRDVFGLSPEGVDLVRKHALARWMDWKRSGANVPAALVGRRSVPPLSPSGPARPIETTGRRIGPTSVLGIGKESAAGLKPGQWTGGRTEAELKAWARAKAPANVQGRPSEGYNRLLGHIWGLPRDTAGGVVQPLPPVSPAARPAVSRPGLKPAGDVVRIAGKGKVEGDAAAVLRGIGRLHDVPGGMPQVVLDVVERDGPAGSYEADVDRVGGAVTPRLIRLSTKGSSPRLTFAHEYGHFLDHAAIPGGERMDRDHAADPLFAGWVEAVKASKSISALRKWRDQYAALEAPTDFQRGCVEQWSYLLRTDELWARSYAQWVATRSGDPAMMRELTEERTATQWGPEEFEPIARAIDALLERLGLLKAPAPSRSPRPAAG